MINIFLGHFCEVLEELVDNKIKISLVIVENKPSNSKVINYCNNNNIKCQIVNNYYELIESVIKHNNIELIFIASFGIIIKDDLIKKSKYIINFHPGDIEICRGRHPLPVAILNKHNNIGITVHLINSSKVDAGPIIRKVTFPINYNESYSFHNDLIMDLLKPLTKSIILEYKKTGNIVSYNWDISKSNYYKPLEKELLDKIINVKKLKDII